MEMQTIPVLEARTLTLQIAIRNTTSDDVFVEQYPLTYDWPPKRDPYVFLHGDGLLLIYFGTVPSPPLTLLAQEITFFSELLPPHQTFTTSISLPLPLLENGKLRIADAQAPHEVVSVSRLRLVVCCRPKDRRMKIREVRPKSGIYDVRYGETEKVETTLSLPQPIPALRRTDKFDRPFDPARVMPPYP